MNNRLYNYILNAVTNNENADKVKNVIGSAKFKALKEISDDELQLKNAIEKELEDEFVRNEFEEEVDILFDVENDFPFKKEDEETIKFRLLYVRELQKFDSKLSYLSKFSDREFSLEKVEFLIKEVEKKITIEYDNFLYLVGGYFSSFDDFNRGEYYLSKSSSIQNKIQLILTYAANSKLEKAIVSLIELFNLKDKSKLTNEDYNRIFSVIADPNFVKDYTKVDIISGLNLLYNSKLVIGIDLSNFLSYIIAPNSKIHQFTQKELNTIISPFLEIIEKSRYSKSPGLIGFYALLSIRTKNNKFKVKANKILIENNYELEELDNYPASISSFFIHNLSKAENFVEYFNSEKLKNKLSIYELSRTKVLLILNIIYNYKVLPLQCIDIKNYKHFKNHHIPIPSQTNIFLGFNGTGKTSLLQAITLGLLPKLDKDINPNDYEKLITIGKEEINIEVNWSDNLLNRKLTIKDTGKTIDYPIFTHHEDEFLSRFILLGYGSNNFTRYTDHNYDNVTQKMLLGDDKFYHVNSLFKDYSDDFYDPLGILNTLDRYEVQDIDGKKAEAKIVKELFLNALNELIVDYQIKQVRTSYKFFRGEEVLDLKHLSEGYRSVVLLVTDILIRVISLRPKPLESISSMEEKPFVLEKVLTDARGTILIDEFNRHLHPQWQRRFIDDLQAVLPNVQFVLTTHSPIAVLGREEDEVQVLEFNEDGEIEIKKHEGGTKNLDVSLTLLKYFGLQSVVSPELQKKIDRYYELQINGERDEALEKELEAANLGIPIYDSRYLKFLEFLKKRNIDIRDMERIEDIEVNNEEWDELENELAELLD